jgi:hypothetical protein
VGSATGAVYGADSFSTVETAWLATGALWAAASLRDAELECLAARLYERIDWHYWTGPEGTGGAGLLRHGKDAHGRFLRCRWDRLNGETAFMYVLAAGAAEGRALSAASWSALRPYYGTVAGLRFNNADLGLFVFQYGLDLLDLRRWRPPGAVDLWAEAGVATRANRRACRAAAARFTTYRRFWGLSAGDGPGDRSAPDRYRVYSPAGLIDGTAHLTAALASVAHGPGAVLENLLEAEHDRQLGARGRYGLSNVNLDHHWVGRDMVGIDAGAAVLALDNYLMDDRTRTLFQGLPCVRRGMGRLGFTPRASRAPPIPAELSAPLADPAGAEAVKSSLGSAPAEGAGPAAGGLAGAPRRPPQGETGRSARRHHLGDLPRLRPRPRPPDRLGQRGPAVGRRRDLEYEPRPHVARPPVPGQRPGLCAGGHLQIRRRPVPLGAGQLGRRERV